MVDEYYCSETTTAQACLGYVSLGCCRPARHTRCCKCQSVETAVHYLPPWFALHTPDNELAEQTSGLLFLAGLALTSALVSICRDAY